MGATVVEVAGAADTEVAGDGEKVEEVEGVGTIGTIGAETTTRVEGKAEAEAAAGTATAEAAAEAAAASTTDIKTTTTITTGGGAGCFSRAAGSSLRPIKLSPGRCRGKCLGGSTSALARLPAGK